MQNGFRVVTEQIPYQQKWEIIVEPWDFQNHKRRPGKVKRTGHFFGANDRKFSHNGQEAEFSKKMKEVQMILVEHFNKKKANV